MSVATAIEPVVRRSLTGLEDHVFHATDSEELAILIGALYQAVPTLVQLIGDTPVNVPGSVNPSGDAQTNHDLIANQFLFDVFNATGIVREVASEESDRPVPCDNCHDPVFSVVLDPLDGSKNVELGWPWGIIVGITRSAICEGSSLNLEAAVVTSFCGRLHFAYAVRGFGTHLFTVNQYDTPKSESRRCLLSSQLETAMLGGNFHMHYSADQHRWLGEQTSRIRFSGSLAADVIHVLMQHRASIWAYAKPKLRFAYEAGPVALMIEESGGAAYCLFDGEAVDPSVVAIKPNAGQCGFVFGPESAVRRFVGVESEEPAEFRPDAQVKMKTQLSPGPGVYAYRDAFGNSVLRVVDTGSIPTYDVVQPSLLFETDDLTLADRIGNRNVFVVVDTTIAELYGPQIQRYLDRHCVAYRTMILESPAESEKTKSADSWMRLHAQLVDQKVTSNDVVLGIGGGTIGDLVGFTASTLRRGVPYMLVSTTLTATIDAAISPKTAISVAGKNSCGTVYPPECVMTDIRFLTTDPVMKTGLAELIKIATVRDRSLFEMLEERAEFLVEQRFQTSEGIRIISEAQRTFLSMKFEEPFPGNQPASLRAFGHTFSRRLETLSGFLLSHGEAVSAEMAIASNLAVTRADLLPCERDRIISLMERLDMIPFCPECSVENIWDVFRSRSDNDEPFWIPVPSCRIGRGTFLNYFNKADLQDAVASVPQLQSMSPTTGRTKYLAIEGNSGFVVTVDFREDGSVSFMEEESTGFEVVARDIHVAEAERLFAYRVKVKGQIPGKLPRFTRLDR